MQPNQYQPMSAQPPNPVVRRILAIFLILGVLSAVLIIFAVVISSGSYAKQSALVAAYYSELAEMSEFTLEQNGLTPATKALASTIKISSNSSLTFVGKISGGTPSSEALSQVSTNYESVLTKAGQANELNDTYRELVEALYTGVNKALIQLSQEDLDENSALIVADLTEDAEIVLSLF